MTRERFLEIAREHNVTDVEAQIQLDLLEQVTPEQFAIAGDDAVDFIFTMVPPMTPEQIALISPDEVAAIKNDVLRKATSF